MPSLHGPLIAASAATALTLTPLAGAITITTATGNGADTFLRRNGEIGPTNAALVVKHQTDAPGNDRIAVLKFDTSSLPSPITDATLRLQTYLASSNQFVNGHVLHLYGVPDRGADEDFDPASLTFSNFDYTTDSGGATDPAPEPDQTNNGVNDLLAVLLASYTFDGASMAGDLVEFTSVSLASFLQFNSNDVATFIVASTTHTPTTTPAFHSANSTTGLAPTLDVVVPEPASLALLGPGAASLVARRWRR